MSSLIATLVRSLFGPPPRCICDREIWRLGVAELKRRSGGRRESGAFLLGTQRGVRRIQEFVFYDDVDPNALRTGYVKIDGRRLGDLWAHCRNTGHTVVADIHVHPGNFQQSESDRANPIIAEVDHLAIILPYFASRATLPGEIGVYEYLGSRQWQDHSFDNPSALHIGWWPWP